MSSKEVEEITNIMLNLKEKIEERLEEQGQEIDNIGYYKDFEFEGSGLAINDAFIVKLKDIENKGIKKEVVKNKDEDFEKEKIQYEIYDKENNLVATVDEKGKVEFDKEYVKSLEKMNKRYFDTLNLDKAKFKLPKELDKDDLVLNKRRTRRKTIRKRISRYTGQIRDRGHRRMFHNENRPNP